MRGPDAYRFERYFTPEPNTGCWLWLGAIDSSGYGNFTSMSPTKHQVGAHRFSWILANGAVPAGLVVDHMCRVRACVNPAHMRLLTPRDNTLCGVGATARHAAKTHCKRGHPFTEANTYRWRTGRICRTCQAQRTTRYKRKAVL